MAQALFEAEGVSAAERATEHAPRRAHASRGDAHLLECQAVTAARRALALEHAHEMTTQELARCIRPGVVRGNTSDALDEVRRHLELAPIFIRGQRGVPDALGERAQRGGVATQQLELKMA